MQAKKLIFKAELLCVIFVFHYCTVSKQKGVRVLYRGGGCIFLSEGGAALAWRLFSRAILKFCDSVRIENN